MILEEKYDLIIIRHKYLKNTLEVTQKILDKAHPIFTEILTEKLEKKSFKVEDSPPPKPEPSEPPDPRLYSGDGEVVEAVREQKDENLKQVFKKIASKTHPDKTAKMTEVEKQHKNSLYEKARLSLDNDDYYGIIEVAEELGIKPPPPSKKQLELMKDTNAKMEKKLKEKQDSILWAWYHADDEGRELLTARYVERLQQIHSRS